MRQLTEQLRKGNNMLPYYIDQLCESPYFKDESLEIGTFLEKDVHLVLTGSTGRRYHSVGGGRAYTKASVDMFKCNREHVNGEVLDTFVIVQRFTWNRGDRKMISECAMTCDEANHLYKSLIKDGFYAR